MNLLPQNIIEYLLGKEGLPEGKTGYDIYMDGINSIFTELMRIYAPASSLAPNELNLAEDANEQTVQEMTSKVIATLSEDYKKRFDDKLTELVDKYNEALAKDAMTKMSPNELQGYLKLLEAESRAIDEFEKELSQPSQKTPNPIPESRPAPIISLTPKD